METKLIFFVVHFTNIILVVYALATCFGLLCHGKINCARVKQLQSQLLVAYNLDVGCPCSGSCPGLWKLRCNTHAQRSFVNVWREGCVITLDHLRHNLVAFKAWCVSNMPISWIMFSLPALHPVPWLLQWTASSHFQTKLRLSQLILLFVFLSLKKKTCPENSQDALTQVDFSQLTRLLDVSCSR